MQCSGVIFHVFRMGSYYETLGLNPNASLEQIKNSYRKLAIAFHPDKNDGVESDKFKNIAAAYTILSDSQQRQIYDKEIGLDRTRD